VLGLNYTLITNHYPFHFSFNYD